MGVSSGSVSLQEEVRRLQQVISDKDDQIANTKKDLEFWRQRFNAAEERAQREVCIAPSLRSS